MELEWRIPTALLRGFNSKYPPDYPPVAYAFDDNGHGRALVFHQLTDMAQGQAEGALAVLNGPAGAPILLWSRSGHLVSWPSAIQTEANEVDSKKAPALVGLTGTRYLFLLSAYLRSADNSRVAAPFLVLRDSDWSFTYLDQRVGPAWITMLPGEGDRVLFEPTRTEAELHFRPEPVLYNLTKVPWFPNERLDSSPAQRMEILDQCRATHPRERAEDEARRALSAP